MALLLASKFANDIPGLPPFVISAANNVYEFMRDMSLLIATGGVAYISNVFQKRSKFIESLEEEWRNIVRTKSVLLSTCEKPYLATDDYLAAYYRISETIDTMRIVYRNAGETDGLIGLYPYAPLHDMRRALQTLDPRRHSRSARTRRRRSSAMRSCKRSTRCARPSLKSSISRSRSIRILVPGSRRLKSPGAAVSALVVVGKTAPAPRAQALRTTRCGRFSSNSADRGRKPGQRRQTPLPDLRPLAASDVLDMRLFAG